MGNTWSRLVGGNSLLEAAENGELVRLKSLIQAGVDVNVHGGCGWTPIMRIVHGGHYNCMKALTEAEADVNRTYNNGNTVLMYAVKHGKHRLLELLI